ncbi:hypothetical protein [Hymenobacter metallicola]|uniref:Uncharacterized protein n=1 Tax=Hymenobacter metallicola TaxID=2563114 RepID=A0A4Z0QK13_9BACT|nr:hypothetical protein [Hymenobacter metallicola]TGE29351.1 hypothetical protein E5K02_07815 [Hymenobacter metallicola]
MFRSLFLMRRLLATTFLVVFVNVFVGQCWCATLAPAPKAAKPVPACHLAAAKRQAAKCHGLAADGKSKAAQSHGSKGQHDCCKDKTTKLLSALTQPAQKLLVPAPALLPEANDFYFRPAASRWDASAPVTLVARQHLPPKIPDIRIYIQSLTV